MSDFWTDKRVIVTGGAGFLGTPTVRMLRAAGAEVFVPRSKEHNLVHRDRTISMFQRFPSVDVVYHLAATVGGIGFSRTHPAKQIYNGLAMGINVVNTAFECGVKRLVFAGSVCAYPKYARVPFVESDLWAGYPEETNAAYGISKRAIIALIQAYRKEYGFNGNCLLLTNMYGPGDNFDPETSHVIPALIRKTILAKNQGIPLTVWGTGSASRDFLYVEDAARALVLAGEKLDGRLPVNVGSGEEVSIRSLVVSIASLVRYSGPVVWDKSKPDGQPRRMLDISRARKVLDWESQVSLQAGLKETIEWYTKKPLTEI